MSLLKRGNKWYVYLYRDGIRHQYATGTSNRKRAEKIQDKLKEELNDRRFGLVESDPTMTFEELAARFIVSGSFRPHHEYHLGFLLPFFGAFPVLRITRSLAEEFRKLRRARNPKITDATVNRDLSVLRRILYWAVDEQLLAANPLARLKMARERRTRRQVLSLTEEPLLLGATKGHLYAMTIIALDTGMRRGEITSQRWEDVDFSQKTLFVTRSKTPEGESREIPLTNRLLTFLTEQRKPEGLVIDFRGRPVRVVKRAWKTALKNAGVRHVRFHDLRHTFNTRLMEAGVLQEVRMALMGHSAGSRVHSTYTHIELPTKRNAIRRLEQWVSDQSQQLKSEQEKQNASSENTGSEIAQREIGTETVEEEIPNRSRVGTRGETQGRNCRDGGDVESQTSAAPEVRGGSETVRRCVAGEGK
ncbi:MAG: tyrosine-type recombinase/integrase [Acidobacteriia bacterium]|nr:tyrosine-type recombinase/integrase [Terriglobia bacterium]